MRWRTWWRSDCSACWCIPTSRTPTLPGSTEIGLFLGTAVHDTSQVVGAALSYKQLFGDDIVLRVATVTKLTRNLFLAAVIPLLTWMHLRSTDGAGAGAAHKKRSWTTYVPAFVLGFVAMAVVRSIGNAMLDTGRAFGVWDAEAWTRLTNTIGDTWGSRYLLGPRWRRSGLNTSFGVFKGVGGKPFIVGFAGALYGGSGRLHHGPPPRTLRASMTAHPCTLAPLHPLHRPCTLIP